MKHRGQTVLLFVALAGVSGLSLFPVFWMFLTAIRPMGEAFARTLHLWPSVITWHNFSRVWSVYPVGDWLLNSIVISTIGGALTVLLSLLAGYAFAKFQFRGRDVLFVLFLSTLMLPTQVFIVPQFMTIAALHGVNTFWAVILPHVAETYGIFLARQFLGNIPDELLDAARLDGASEWSIFWRVVLPLSKPAIAVLSLLLVLGYWNDFGWPLVVLKDERSMTLPVGLSFLLSEHVPDWPGLMIIALLSILPITVLFIFLQRFFIQGIARTGLK